MGFRWCGIKGSWEKFQQSQTQNWWPKTNRYGTASTGESVVHSTTDFSGIRTGLSYIEAIIIWWELSTWQQGVCASAMNTHPAQYRCMLQRKHLFVVPCLAQFHSPPFFFEMTNIVATHCGCSHVADESKQLISCLRSINGTVKSFIAKVAAWLQRKLSFWCWRSS